MALNFKSQKIVKAVSDIKSNDNPTKKPKILRDLELDKPNIENIYARKIPKIVRLPFEQRVAQRLANQALLDHNPPAPASPIKVKSVPSPGSPRGVSKKSNGKGKTDDPNQRSITEFAVVQQPRKITAFSQMINL